MIHKWTSRCVAILLTLAAARVVWVAGEYFANGRAGRHRVEAAWIILVTFGALRIALSGGARSSGLSPEPPGRSLRAAQLSILVVSSIALYWPAVSAGLFSDDFALLALDSSSILRADGWQYFRPLPLMAWKLLFPLGSTAALHLLNMVLHGTNAWLTARLAGRLGHAPLMSMIAGVIFLTFPAAVEPVVWNSGIFDVALVTFALLYLDSCLVSRGVLTGLLWLTCALLCKETAVALPLVATVVCLRARKIPVRLLAGSAILTIVYVAVRLVWGIVLPTSHGASIRYAAKEVVARPFATLAVPYSASELAQHPLLLGVGSVTVIAMFVWLYCVRPHAGARPITGAAVAVLGVVPLWQFVFIGDALDGSRYLYLPLVGWSVLLADLADHPARRRRYACAGTMVIAIVLPNIWYSRQHQAAWQAAGRLRDAVLHSASAALADSNCTMGQFRNVPDSFEGAYVFRNGFREALKGRAVTAGGEVPPACDFTWTNGRFFKTQ